jgi:glucosamine-6-phosphate deaminase
MHALRIRQFDQAHGAARALARHVARCVRSNPTLVLGLPTGRTSVALYRELVALHESGEVDFSRARTFNLDEFVGVDASQPGSYRAFMRRHLFDHVNLRPSAVHFLDGRASDLRKECERYERAIARAGGLDLLILGLGANGHIGFNEPADALVASTHVTQLARSTRRANAALFDHRPARVPSHALSMGMATILRARRIVLLATGASKAVAVKRLVEGRITPRVPASFLQLHPDAQLCVDRAAASRLSRSH